MGPGRRKVLVCMVTTRLFQAVEIPMGTAKLVEVRATEVPRTREIEKHGSLPQQVYFGLNVADFGIQGGPQNV
jgi:hypothetical protein